MQMQRPGSSSNPCAWYCTCTASSHLLSWLRLNCMSWLDRRRKDRGYELESAFTSAEQPSRGINGAIEPKFTDLPFRVSHHLQQVPICISRRSLHGFVDGPHTARAIMSRQPLLQAGWHPPAMSIRLLRQSYSNETLTTPDTGVSASIELACKYSCSPGDT